MPGFLLHAMWMSGAGSFTAYDLPEGCPPCGTDGSRCELVKRAALECVGIWIWGGKTPRGKTWTRAASASEYCREPVWPGLAQRAA